MIKTIKDLEEIKEKGLQSIYPDKIKISVGMSSCGLAQGAEDVYNEIKSEIEKNKLEIELAKTGCLGLCQMEPIVDVWISGMGRFTYKQMTPVKIKEVLPLLLSQKTKKEYLLCRAKEDILIDMVFRKFDLTGANGSLNGIYSYQEIPFFTKQKKIVLRNCGFINPESVEEYIARDGYYALYKALTSVSPEQIIEEIKKSGLRGRGGAGFPTGKKWEFTREAGEKIKYIICNADEGDPGAYMDRSILEGDPHSVLEGMIIGAYAIGAVRGFIYVRTEYLLAIKRLKQAIFQAKEYGLLGENIFYSGFNFDIDIREGSGAFVCGEETALLHSIEGSPPEPRQRPPFPVQAGLWGFPTNINNVETWANVPVIIQRKGEWFANIGTEKSKGTKVFSIVGKINRSGLIEVPMGISLKEIIYDIGGGILEGKKFKAVQTGGPSGGCIPEELLDLPVDYDSLKNVGSIMGSGGMVVMDETNCMVDVAKFFLSFTNFESCGKCTSCREGSDALLEILTRISQGKGEEEDLVFLQDLSEAVKNASLCGLGQTLPNPVLSTLKYFRDEYEVHIREKRCPAGVCKALFSYYIAPEKCQACSLCAKNCPVNAISGEEGIVYVIDQNKCTKCGNCFEVCPKKFCAVTKISTSSIPLFREKIKVKKNKTNHRGYRDKTEDTEYNRK